MLTSGRVSIATALRVMGVERGERVLLPAYNCKSMVDPVSAMGYEPVLYKINPDLTIDLTDITDDGEKDDLKGEKGLDELISGVKDKLKQ